ncbi:MAG TPA: acyl-CoA dehydrogenase [Alphaproteobacteria bacterium]|jgi:alkylation response protein AidB-like acyl-CoA dehydrogenase|nr:acyl-CoA dehydrogenase [Alphaproteobacteria bacterium]HCO90405.1 acyl-CoA dehydrogenase [Alphaproteobacteria bacterium]
MNQYSLTEEQLILRETVRKFALEKVAPRAQEIDDKAEYPQDMFEALTELGLFALPFPEEYGGANSVLSSCLAVEELGRICYNTAYLLIVQWVPFGAILYGGNQAQKDKYLAPLSTGAMRAAISVTEASGGSDVAGIKTRADKVDGGYRLNGQKIFSTNAAIADFVVVAAKTDPTKRHGGISAFIVEKGMDGFEIGKGERKLGSRGVPSSPLYFTDCFVPEENRIGPEGEGFGLVMEAFNKSRPIIGARGIGLAQGAIDLSVAYVREREAFGQAVSDFQGVQWMLADMAMQTEAARHLVYKAASIVDSGATRMELAPIAAMAKCFATDVAMKVATDALQLFGSAGVSKDNRIEQYFRDAKVLQIIEGTNQIQRNIIGKHVVRTF